jgi:hypothetical protein
MTKQGAGVSLRPQIVDKLRFVNENRRSLTGR